MDSGPTVTWISCYALCYMWLSLSKPLHWFYCIRWWWHLSRLSRGCGFCSIYGCSCDCYITHKTCANLKVNKKQWHWNFFCRKVNRVTPAPQSPGPMETTIPNPVFPGKSLAPTPLEVLHNGTRQSTSSTNTSDYFSMNSREVEFHQVSISQKMLCHAPWLSNFSMSHRRPAWHIMEVPPPAQWSRPESFMQALQKAQIQ